MSACIRSSLEADEATRLTTSWTLLLHKWCSWATLSSTELPSSISLSFRIHDLASTVVTSHEQTCLLALALVISSLSRMLLLGSADVSVIRLINSEILVESELFEWRFVLHIRTLTRVVFSHVHLEALTTGPAVGTFDRWDKVGQHFKNINFSAVVITVLLTLSATTPSLPMMLRAHILYKHLLTMWQGSKPPNHPERSRGADV